MKSKRTIILFSRWKKTIPGQPIVIGQEPDEEGQMRPRLLKDIHDNIIVGKSAKGSIIGRKPAWNSPGSHKMCYAAINWIHKKNGQIGREYQESCDGCWKEYQQNGEGCHFHTRGAELYRRGIPTASQELVNQAKSTALEFRGYTPNSAATIETKVKHLLDCRHQECLVI